MELTITSSRNGTSCTVCVAGEVDVSNAPELRSKLDHALASDATTVEVDMGQVPYIDSTGIGVLVGTAHRASEQGKNLVIANPQRNVSRVLSLLGVGDELNLRASE